MGWIRKTPRQFLRNDFISVGRTKARLYCIFKYQIEFIAPKYGLIGYDLQKVGATTASDRFHRLREYLVQSLKRFIGIVVHLTFPLEDLDDIRMCKILALE